MLDDPLHLGLQRLIGDLNRVYRASPALWTQDTSPGGFSWIDANDASNNTFSFLRWGDDGSVLACVVNFAGGPHEGYRVGLPRPGRWEEVVNTDAEAYGGSGVGNFGAVKTSDEPWHGQPVSVRLRVPPLGGLWLRYAGPARD
jgi:1,4-alpha-glucan branching enzyme